VLWRYHSKVAATGTTHVWAVAAVAAQCHSGLHHCGTVQGTVSAVGCKLHMFQTIIGWGNTEADTQGPYLLDVLF